MANKRRGQAALEFLTTYGWAFMIILVMIGALAYFGVLNPRNLIPDSCSVQAGFSCGDYMLDGTVGSEEVNLILINNLGRAIDITSDVVFTIAGTTVATCAEPGTNWTNVPDGAEIEILGCTANNDIVSGEKIKAGFAFA